MGEVDMLNVKPEVELDGVLIELEEHASYLSPPVWDALPRAQESKENIKSDALSTAQNITSRLVQLQSPLKDAGFSASPMCPAPLCRQFWKAGNYEDELVSKSQVQNSKNYLHVHPKFLHSNATSHKWAFGAIAELLDNAIDEIQNGASFVSVDKILNPRDGSLGLLFLDDGGGMGPEAIRRCMSFGFSDKESKSTIGRYGNGFKTSSMRLGADVIVFSRHVEHRKLTQSIGLLSYTYLSRNGLDRIVVPMVDYEFNVSTNAYEPLYRFGQEHYESNISIILQWSPYSTEVELMKQFDDIGSHGTKVIVYNLWLTDDGVLEFDFESDPQDIRLRPPDKSKVNSRMLISEDHIGNQYRYSLRVYMSILYLHIPPNFSITLCGKAVDHHRIAHDLKYPEFIMYRPQTGVTNEEVLTIIGFLKEAPHVYLHGFNVYHKNRLILPFWHVVSYSDSRGRGVVGILEANFVEPTHNKQDFERTSLFQKLETRLKEMTSEYWDHRCGLIGYQVKKKLPVSLPSVDKFYSGSNEPNPLVTLPAEHFQNAQSSEKQGTKRMPDDVLRALGRGKRQARAVFNSNSDGNCQIVQPVIRTMVQNKQEALLVVQQTKKLREKCLELEKSEEELNYKVMVLTRDLEEAQQEFAKMSAELQALEVKGEKSVGNQGA